MTELQLELAAETTSLMMTAGPNVSFDDLSAQRDGDDFLLVLISTASASIVQSKHQNRALTILEAHGLQPEVLDAADPANAVVKTELGLLSGRSGHYPHLFLVEGDRTTFLGGFDELDRANEQGQLLEWLSMDFELYPLASASATDETEDVERGEPSESSCSDSSIDPMVSTAFPSPGRLVDKKEDVEEEEEETSTTGLYEQEERYDEIENYIHAAVEGDHVGQMYAKNAERETLELQRQEHVDDDVVENDADPFSSPEKEQAWREEMCHQAVSKRSLELEELKQSLEKAFDDSMESDGLAQLSTNQSHDDSIYEEIAMEERTVKASETDAALVSGLQILKHEPPIVSCDDSVDTSATSSSILTWNRNEVDLRIQPDTEIHFQLVDETPRCTVTLTNLSESFLPLAFKVQASNRRRYMVWPSVGVIRPQSSVSVRVFLVDGAKQDLLNLFEKLGPAAEFRQKDKLWIEWCGAPTDFCNQLTGKQDDDLETMWSFWNNCQKNDAWSSEQSFLRVRVSANTQESPQQLHHLRHHQHQKLQQVQQLSYAPYSYHTPTREDVHAGTKTPTTLMSSSVSRKIPSSTSMDTVSTVASTVPSIASEMEQRLQAEVENLRRKCEELTAERYIIEQQLEEERQRHSPLRNGAIHKFQLQQTLRCGSCLKVFKSNPSSLLAPIASQACGHSICRNCCYRRSQPQPRHSLSSDLLMCVDMSQLSDDSCPICHIPHAFDAHGSGGLGGKLHVNQSLCTVLKLLDTTDTVAEF